MNKEFESESGAFNPEIICIDDDKTQLLIYKNILKNTGFKISVFNDPKEAFEKIKEKRADLVLLDLNMPGMDGFEFMNGLKKLFEYNMIPVIMISSYSSDDNVISAFKKGAVDFIRKPFCKDEFIMRIKLHMQNIILKKMNNLKFENLKLNVIEKMEEVKDIKNATIFALAKIAESRDPETGDHLERIREYVKVLAERLSLNNKFKKIINNEFIYNIYHMSALHDIGKVGIPDCILLKPDKLTQEEFKIMKTHTIIGGKALDKVSKLNNSSSFLEMGRDIAYFHHESWDGNGYPFGLKGEEIPLAARITTIADVFDALSFKRIYRKSALSDGEIGNIMKDEAGNLFDPELYETFNSIRNKFMEIKKIFV